MFNFTKEVSHIEGWLTEAEGYFLYDIAKRIYPGNTIVEIGSWKGKSTICLGNGSRDGGKAIIYAIDPHQGSSEHQKTFGEVDTFPEFTQNINKASLDEFIRPIRQTSEEAANSFSEPIEFVFIDGAHEYQLVNLDFKMWFPKVVVGGKVAFHDSWHFMGPNLVSAFQLLKSTEITSPRLIDTITCFEKVDKNSIANRIYNVLFILYRTLVGFIGFLKLKYRDVYRT